MLTFYFKTYFKQRKDNEKYLEIALEAVSNQLSAFRKNF